MRSKITVEIIDGFACIRSPFDRDYVTRIKALGGKWDSDTYTWVIREEKLEAARAIMLEIYGETDIPNARTVTAAAEAPKIDRKALESERTELIKRLFEIEKMLAAPNARQETAQK